MLCPSRFSCYGFSHHASSQDMLETTPLLSNPEPLKRSTTRIQIAVLCLVRMCDPVAFTQIFPFINEFLAYLHVTDDPSQIGYFSGLVESTFAVSQLLFIYQTARLSDKFGRRPVIMIGTLGVALATTSFGISNNIFELLVSRSLAGVFAGTASVVHTVLGEITDNTNQAAVFSLYGPLIGGTFSTPAAKFTLFEQTIFDRHPYFLPCLIAGISSISGFVLAYFFLEETLPSQHRYGKETKHAQSAGTQAATFTPPSARELLSYPILRSLFVMLRFFVEDVLRSLSVSGMALELNQTSFGVLFVLYCYTPIGAGGLAFPATFDNRVLSSPRRPHSRSSSGFLLPFLLRRFEAASIYNISIAAWPITFLFLPILNIIARRGLNESTQQMDDHSRSALWVGLAIVLALSRVGGIAFSASMILVRNNVPRPSYLGAANGLVQTSMCLSRCISAAFASSVFAFSDKYNILGGYFWAVLHAFLALVGCSIGRNITRHSRKMLEAT
ncbi:hypothetical protein D9757_001790 [Collybiopsis confluens]|uniref:MFS general substrate transporter n=1 Tax=Collybiopsis confluens TaxID=2823264 RepID=A0A8H5HYU4_9AGAR|nr:hypothetical protein D9757_001790 [Collybiopsis confluens]